MAKSGLKHADVGAELSKTEWESEEIHELLHGTSFPSSPAERQLFYRDDEHKWYIHNGTGWTSLVEATAQHGNEKHTSTFITGADVPANETDPSVDATLKGITLTQVRDHTPKAGTVMLLYNDEDDSSETTSSTKETEKKAWTLPANSYSKIIIEAEVRDRIEQDAATRCDFTWRIKVGGSTVKTVVNRIIAMSSTGVDSGGREVLSLKTIVAGGQTENTAISLTGQMSINDAATGILAHSLRVYGVV